MDAATEKAAEFLRFGDIQNATVRSELLHQVARGLFGENSAVLKQIDDEVRKMAPEGGPRELESTLLRLADMSTKIDMHASSRAATPQPITDDIVLDRIAGSFMRHWTGKALLAVVALCLGMIGINVGVMTFQTTGLLKIKADAEAAGEQASLAAQKAKASADEAVLRINQRFSDTRAMEQQAVHEASERIASQGISALDRTKIEDRAIDTMRSEAKQGLSQVRGQIDALKPQIQKLSLDVEAMESARTDVVRARSEIARYQAEAKIWHDTVERQKETLKDTAMVRATWATLNAAGWLTVVSLVFLFFAAVGAILAWRRAKA